MNDAERDEKAKAHVLEVTVAVAKAIHRAMKARMDAKSRAKGWPKSTCPEKWEELNLEAQEDFLDDARGALGFLVKEYGSYHLLPTSELHLLSDPA